MERRTKCKDKIVDRTLKALFFKLGHTIGEHPLYFLLVPLLLTALCVSGFQQMDYEFDPEYLFSPTSGFAKQERALQESHFPTNYSSFKSSRITRTGKFARVIVSAKDGGSILRTQLWNQLLYLDQVGNNLAPHACERTINLLTSLSFLSFSIGKRPIYSVSRAIS
jgi:hypothetical protein